ncbi:MAG: hypothetical protein JW991_03730 [Candidatus Pacebacteria bacterium]|nr:hypothetical protein [Candidatus Paceibacterota bacterium]
MIAVALIAGSVVYWRQKTLFQVKWEGFQLQLASLNSRLESAQQENEELAKKLSIKSEVATGSNQIEEPASDSKWNKFISDSSGPLAKTYLLREDGLSYSSVESDISFSIEYPADWTCNNGVFSSKGKKIAEFSPGLVILQPGQGCFEGGIMDHGGELISETTVSIGGRQGIHRVEICGYEGGYPDYIGTWYPNIFCLEEGEKAFKMSFYEHELGAGDRALFEKILATLKFE